MLGTHFGQHLRGIIQNQVSIVYLVAFVRADARAHVSLVFAFHTLFQGGYLRLDEPFVVVVVLVFARTLLVGVEARR